MMSTLLKPAGVRRAMRALALAPLGASLAMAQTAAPPAEPPPVVQAAPPVAAPAPAPEPARPGLVDELGKLFQAPSWSLPPLKSPQQTIEDLNKGARDATDNLSRMSRQTVVTGRVKCPLAANGAPDCKAAADRMCIDKGYKDGQSLDSDSAESCPASVLLSGRQEPQRGSCKVENFVIRALCQ